MKPTQDTTHCTHQPSTTRVSLTARDLDLLSVLVRQVRILSMAQIASCWWPRAQKSRTCAQRLKRLSNEGYIRQLQVMSHPPVELDTWVIKWKTGKTEPDFHAASYSMKKRWSLPPETVTVIVATNRTRTLFGDRGEYSPRPSEITHDLHLSAVFLKMRKQRPALAKSWTGETILARQRSSPNEKIPDALVRKGREKTVIDFGGSYSAARLRQLHDYCSERSYAYEVW